MSHLADREEIRDILYLYTHAIDRRRWDMMPALFHEDAVFLFGAVEGDWRGFVEQAKIIIDPMPTTHHQIGNILFKFDGDVALTETYCTATHVVPADYPEGLPFPGTGERYVTTIGLRYIDKFEKRDGKWAILSRNGIYDWRHDGNFNDGGILDNAPDMMGKHNDSDPSTPVTAAWRHV